MAHVRTVQRAKGVAYEVRFTVNGKERQKTFTDKREAERHALRVEIAKSTGASTAELAGRSEKFEAVARTSLDASRPRLKPGTILQYENLYDTRILPTFGTTRISAITSQQVQGWVSGLVAAGKAPNTVHNHYVALNKVFRYAIKHRIISHNPCESVELPKNVHAEGFAPVFLTTTQVAALAAALEDVEPYGLLVRLSALTGCVRLRRRDYG